MSLAQQSAADALLRWRLDLEAAGESIPTDDELAAIREYAAERAGIAAESGGAVRGLVSVPTTVPGHSAAVALDACEKLQRALRRGGIR